LILPTISLLGIHLKKIKTESQREVSKKKKRIKKISFIRGFIKEKIELLLYLLLILNYLSP